MSSTWTLRRSVANLRPVTDPPPTPRTVFVGNCQAAALHWLYNHSIVQDPVEKARCYDGRSLDEAARNAIANADTVVLQVTDLGDVPQLGGANQKVVLFPYVSGGFVWPYATENHVKLHSLPLSEFKTFSVEYGGDRFLNKLFLAGATERQAVDQYLALDIANEARLERRYDLGRRTQQGRDNRAGIEIADYIDRNLSREGLFCGRGHICRGLLLHLATQVFDKMGAPSRALNRMERGLPHSPLEGDMVPIHPAVVKQFGLAPLRRDGLYLFNKVLVDFEQYVERYIRMDGESDLLRGMNCLSKADLEAAVENLERGLARSRQSPDGWLALSSALDGLGRKDEALFAIRRAVQVDTENLSCLLHLARTLLARGDLSGSEAALNGVLKVRPDLETAHQLMAIVLEHQNRCSEGLRHLRRVFDAAEPTAAMVKDYRRLAHKVGNEAAVDIERL